MAARVQQLPAFGWWCEECRESGEYASRAKAQYEADIHNTSKHPEAAGGGDSDGGD